MIRSGNFDPRVEELIKRRCKSSSSSKWLLSTRFHVPQSSRFRAPKLDLLTVQARSGAAVPLTQEWECGRLHPNANLS